MVSNRSMSIALVLLAWVTYGLPEADAVTKTATNRLHDVALQDGGVFVGQVLDSQGIAVPGVPVTISKSAVPVARVSTDKDGKFRVAGLTGGVHQVAIAQQATVCRLWAPQTAPPAAQRGLLVVSSTDVLRGQCGCGTPVCGSGCCQGGVYGRGAAGGGLSGWMVNHPILTTGGIAAAIAIPLAVDDDDSPATP